MGLFLVLFKHQYNFSKNKRDKRSIYNPVLGFELATSCTRVSSSQHHQISAFLPSRIILNLLHLEKANCRCS